MAEVKLTHKLRNPKSYNEWMDIWSAHAQDGVADPEDPSKTIYNYTINPSEHWKIPANQITDYIYTPEPTQDNPNPNPITEKNTTIENPEGNHIAITNSDGSISEGPEIDQDSNVGTNRSFLNERGQWVPINLFINPIYSQNIETGSAPSGYSVYNPYGTENVLSVKFGDPNIWSWLGQYYIGSAENTIRFWTLNDSWDQRHGHRIIIDVDQIDSKHIKDNAVTTDKLADSSVTEDKLADNSVTENKLVDNSVTTPKIADSSVTEDKLADEAVTTNKLADNSVTENKLADECITINKIAQSAIDAIDTWQPNTLDQEGYVEQPLPTSKPLVWATPKEGEGQPQWMTVREATGDSTVSVKKIPGTNKATKISDTKEIYRLDLLETVVTDVTYTINTVTEDVASIETTKVNNSVSGTTLSIVQTVVTNVVYTPPS